MGEVFALLVVGFLCVIGGGGGYGELVLNVVEGSVSGGGW